METWVLDDGVIKVCLEVTEDPGSVAKLFKNILLKEDDSFTV